MRTEIIAKDSRGKVVYHYSEPRHLSDAEVDADLKGMMVDKSTHQVTIIRS